MVMVMMMVVMVVLVMVQVVFGVRVVRRLLPPQSHALRYRFVQPILLVLVVVAVVVARLQTGVFGHAIVTDLDDRPRFRVVMVRFLLTLMGRTAPSFGRHEHHRVQLELSQRRPGHHDLVQLILLVLLVRRQGQR